MNVQVKHNGTNITGYVQAYEREHKICTGIGTLRVEVIRTIPRTFDPWDSIDIYENGSFRVRYYISSVEDIIPRGIQVLECQDLSKRLVDYFIPDSYTIDYPSYTRYWIERFLTEAGVSYSFNTTSQGQLISNNTQLGLSPLYEQLLTLLQMSGWYIYFNQAEEAVIGPLNGELGTGGRSIGKSDILEISRVSDDKMLRNRALILGTFDPFTMTYASADVTVHTPWNYDSRDVRAVVISNSNIPNKGSAYTMANQIIKEFARITVEKHITLWGARNYNLGDFVRVNSTVWKGRGMITTFGTSMSKQGLVTNIVLDERCPRLFGFFNFGDYVYVGTYGNGIWKKHIKFDPNWYDFSAGLTNPAITDLHINNGVFGSVASSGEMYYTFDDGGWNQITLSSLMSSAESTIVSGSIVTYTPYSGIMARAVIVDKIGNTIKFGVDTYSGMNYGDYFLDNYTQSGITSSGFVTGSGGNRGWILEYDPFTGNLVGGIGSGIYPISYSGDYNVTVIDLENDGLNDYVSVQAGSASGVFIPDGYDLGNYNTTTINNTFDIDSVVASPIPTIADPLRTSSYSPEIKNDSAAAFFDDAMTGNRHMIHIKFNGDIVKRSYSMSSGSLVATTTSQSGFNGTFPLAIHKLESEIEHYRIYYMISNTGGDFQRIYYKDWDVPTNTVSSATQIYSYTGGRSTALSIPKHVSLNGELYVLFGARTIFSRNPFFGWINAEIWDYILVRIKLETGNVISDSIIYSLTTPAVPATSPQQYEHFYDRGITLGMSACPIDTFQDGETLIRIIIWNHYGNEDHNVYHERVIVCNMNGVVSDTEVYNGTTNRFPNLEVNSIQNTQLTRDKGTLISNATGGNLGFATNGDTYIVFTGAASYYLDGTKIYPMYSRSQSYYIALNGSTFVACDPTSLSPVINISTSPDYTYRHPWSMPTTYGDEVFWYGWLNATGDEYLIKTPSILDASSITTFKLDFNGSTTTRGFNTGGWFIHGFSTAFTTPITYYYFQGGELQFPRFLVLQRENSDFNLIEEEPYPIRLDISNNSPVLTLGSGENSFVSNFIYGDTLEQIIYASGQVIKVEDYRYTYLETTFSGIGGISTSGMPVQVMGLYIAGSGVYAGDVSTYSGGFSVMYDVPSGWGNRIETSNYGVGGQYIFVTTSGDYPMFYQADPGIFGFTSYSGLPQSRATCIRLDDRI